MSGWTYTPPNSVRTMEPVGQASRHPAFSQCLQTSDENSHVTCDGELPPCPACGSPSTNFTWRHVEWPRAAVLSYESAVKTKPSDGTSFHSLHATSHALQPMQSVESVRKPVIAIHYTPGQMSLFVTLQVRAFDSKIFTLGSSEIASRSLTMSPVTSPLRPK